MEKKDCFYFGKIYRPHGYKGELKIYIDADDPEAYGKLDMIFVDIKKNFVPFFIERIHFENNKANLKLQDIDTIEQAERMAGCELYLPLELLGKLRGNKFYYHEVIGFKVIDEIKGDIGTIDRVLDLPNNPLLLVIFNNKEILIPITDEIIQKVDRKKKEIQIRAPEGLIDIYLE